MKRAEKTIAQLVGENVRRLRGDFTLEDLAFAGKRLGSNWSSGSISSIERGNFKVTIENLLLLSIALGEMKEQPAVPLSELLSGEGWLRITPVLRFPQDMLRGYLSGIRVDDGEKKDSIVKSSFEVAPEDIEKEREKFPGPWNLREEISLVRAMIRQTQPVEERIAKRLDMDPRHLKIWVQYLWDTSFEEQRDIRAGDGASAQKRGRVSRELMEEIRKARDDFHGNN
ncbi:hypothetical protein WG936_06015 [Corynebacterium sp. H127]|uniref:hypothetical protein n=1 Tax=Corynebacterium sp. H127 TaxID=3133418 RepID=UPI0030AC2C38